MTIYGRTPGMVANLRAHALGVTRIELEFSAAGNDGNQPPPARSYVIKESRRPNLTEQEFATAPELCSGACRFGVAQVGDRIDLTITHLRPHTTYYFTIAARDNITGRPSPRSAAVQVRTR